MSAKNRKSTAKDAAFKAGAARRNINPPQPQFLTQTGMGRLEQTIGVLDDIFVEALAFEVNGQAAFVTTGDLRIVTRDWEFRVRQEIGRRIGCDPQRVLMSSNHNHSSSPAPWNDTPEAKAALEEANEKIVQAFIDACLEAWENRRPAEIAYGEAELRDPAGENRGMRLSSGVRVQCWGSGSICPPGQKLAGPAGPHATNVRFLAVRQVGKGKPFTLLTAYPSHIHIANLPYFSGEAAGGVKREIQRRLGGNLIAMYANNMGGNIDVHCIHPSALGPMEEKAAWFSESANILGRRFADAVVPAVKKLSHYTRPTTMRHRYWSTGDDAARQDPNFRLTIVNSLALGDVVFMSIPGEVFIEYYLRLVKKSPVKKFLLLGYNGSSHAYVAEPIAFERGGYETMRGPAELGQEPSGGRPAVMYRPSREEGERLEARLLDELRAIK